jgi:very-short-patch-repair endonuclease
MDRSLLRRRHPCGPFILDFFCAERVLAVELDGGQHWQSMTQAYDARRTSFLVARGITVLRFGSDKVFLEPHAVLAVIAVSLGIDDPSP